MSDFTKEELEFLEFIIIDATPFTDDPIYKKIQSMIEKYNDKNIELTPNQIFDKQVNDILNEAIEAAYPDYKL